MQGSLDFTGKFITIDIADKNRPDIVKRKINKYNDIIGAIFNFNPRLTQGKSNKKNDQFRIPMDYYMGRFGLFTPYKIDYYKNEKNKKLKSSNIFNEIIFIDSEFKNLKLNKKFISDRNLKINDLAIELKDCNISIDEKSKIIDKYRIDNLSSDTDDEIMFSSQNVKESVKMKYNYICEFNTNHVTFTSKSNNKNYIEAHHLIPFCERNNFDLNIDVEENIVCLCPNCHRKIHLATDEEKKSLIKLFFNKKKKNLEKIGINLNIDDLFKYYNIEEN